MSDDKPQFDWDSDAGFDEEGDGPSMDDVGEFAEDYDHTQRPRRVQMNVKIADEVKQRFKEKVEAENLEMQFVVEDLLRMYLRNS
ncbi:hypothetical protein GGP78_003172 [Salinibacter ruber]|uniref:hypothetical protein n=1 Tax=Salinibacter ruber TaxID=146919 RepID=UPI002167B742|nr:hypothetical protein [Salinibacter ruber]MCS3856469.1 hypothetical protein [Salinibacter ruber]